MKGVVKLLITLKCYSHVANFPPLYLEVKTIAQRLAIMNEDFHASSQSL
jgi:hypothetical protein